MAAAVLVLQPFASQGGAARRGAEQETARALVGSSPDLVANALKAKHRVVDVKGKHRQSVHAVAGGGCGPAGDRAGLRYAFFEYLAVECFAVAQHRSDVLGRVLLPDAGIDADLLEQVGHAEGARLVGHDRYDARAQRRVLEQAAEHTHEGHGRAHFLAVGLGGEGGKCRQGGHRYRVAAGFAAGQIAAERFALRVQVPHLLAIVRGFVKRQAGCLRVGQRQLKAVAEIDQVAVVELLLAVRGHLALAGAAHAKTLLGVRQDHGRLTPMPGRRRVGSEDLHQVVSAALEAVDLLVRHSLRESDQLRVLAEKVFAVVAPVFGSEGLHLAVNRVGEGARQRAAAVACKQAIPVAAPDQLHDVPAGTGEQFFQLIDDAAVAAHRPVEALQVAVDDPHQVVEALARSQRQRTHRLWLVHLAVAKNAPHLAAIAVEQLSVRQVAHEARLKDRADRAYAHRAGGELPEVRHQVGVRVARQAARTRTVGAAWCAYFLAVVHQVLLVEPALQIGACVHPGCAMRLKKDQIA